MPGLIASCSRCRCALRFCKCPIAGGKFHFYQYCLQCGKKYGSPVASRRISSFDALFPTMPIVPTAKSRKEAKDKGLPKIKTIIPVRVYANSPVSTAQKVQWGSYELRVMPYPEYLKTEHWKKVSMECRHYYRFRCAICNKKGETHVHHRTYERRGCEEPSDLVCLCAECHGKFHDKLPVE